VIRHDSASVIQDVAISDYKENSSTCAYTSSDGAIRFNKTVMSDLSSKERQYVATHELGHALGLKHHTSSDMMYKYETIRITLNANENAFKPCRLKEPKIKGGI